MKPEQCRAGRALLNWSQDELEAESKVAKKTIADFERGALIPFPNTLKDLEYALGVGGVQLIPENGGGAGVRLRDAKPRLSRTRVSLFERKITLVMSYRDRELQVSFSTNILDDIDRANHDEAGMKASVQQHIKMILLRAAKKFDDEGDHPRGMLHMTSDDFPETH